MRKKHTYILSTLLSFLSFSSQSTPWIPPESYEGIKQAPSNPDNPVNIFEAPHQQSLTQVYKTVKKEDETEEQISRADVPNDKISWNVSFPGYTPTEYTNPSFMGEGRLPFAQSENIQDIIKTQEKGGLKSHYTLHMGGDEKRPLNPMGRTGLSGRGELGHWAANRAVDGLFVRKTELNGWELFLIFRKRDHIQALPGGMQEEDSLDVALTKETAEEVGAEIAKTLKDKEKNIVYRGYVDDPRNTDNAWMETTGFSIFFSKEETTQMPDQLNPTDTDEVDAEKNAWVPLKELVDAETQRVKEGRLFASHHKIINHMLDQYDEKMGLLA